MSRRYVDAAPVRGTLSFVSDEKSLARVPAARHWAHSFVDRATSDLAKTASSSHGIGPYVGRVGSSAVKVAIGTATGSGLGTVDALFGEDAGNTVAGATAAIGFLGSVALAGSPGAAEYASTLGASSLACLARSATRKLISGGRQKNAGGSTTAPGGSATDRISAVAAKMGQPAPNATEVSAPTK